MGLLSRLFTRKAEPPAIRRFDGAAGGRRASGMGSFGKINPEVAAAGASLRSRAAYLANNNPWLSQGVANWTGALVGAGIQPTSRHPDKATRRALNAYFEAWATEADAEGRADFWGIQAQIAQSMVTAGEGLALLIDTDEGPRLRALPPELLDESRTAELPEGRAIFAGVEVDANGRRDAFWIIPERPASVFANYAPAQRIDAANVLHVFRPIAPGQLRGVSWLAPVVLPASDFDQLCDALLVGAKTAAMFCAFVTNQNAVGGEDPFEGEDVPSLEPGTLQRLGGGWDIKFASPQQAQQIDSFLKLNLRQLAAGLGLPDHLLSGDLTGANYSSLRAGLLPFRQRVEQIQYQILVPQLLAPTWRAVIRHGILTDQIDAPDFEQNPGHYLRADWLPPKPLQVDPLKDINATVAEIEAGLTSRRKAIAERGWVPDDLEDEIAAERTPNASED
ncbi:phage portal protein [Rhodovulum steppense]|uniref:Lambda family phage portal protein n=1 Tax=Rhodovulum steppense TaxID=540251 RepID=A0A4R1YWM6_9RHOB|nr:phage portal protein [Rhodovulum steppense]TCM85173.1 lambda family phage portal protein [Rhodovulum steppense]